MKEKKPKMGTKRHASEENDVPSSPKRRKAPMKNGKGAVSKKSKGNDAARKKTSTSGAKSRRKSTPVHSDAENSGNESRASPEKASVEPGNDDDDASKPPRNTVSPTSRADDEQAEKAEEEEYSDVIDEPPPQPKRRKKEPKRESAKPSKPAVKKTSASSASDDPQEAEIKKLQSQLVKCGIRKLWHNELKSCGNDARAKIRHLKGMLAEIGMDGRFSEAKAREIKESRELLADVEAAREMDRLWGKGTGGRASRSKHKSMKFDDTDDSDEGGQPSDGSKGDDDDKDDDETSFAARRRRAQADLAFLGDDSDSE